MGMAGRGGTQDLFRRGGVSGTSGGAGSQVSVWNIWVDGDAIC